MLQMKEHGENPQNQTCKKEIGSLSEKKRKIQSNENKDYPKSLK